MKTRVLWVLLVPVACSPERAEPPPAASTRGFSGPEAVRYDPELDVWFVANFNGEAEDDSNGFISKLDSAGLVVELRFMRGTLAPLHGPRGMYITGDTLWAADADGVHAFHRRTGAHLAFIDFRPLEPGFLNDIALAGDGALYITDTGRDKHRVYRLRGRDVTIAIEDRRIGNPNGITWDQFHQWFLLAGWGEGGSVIAWRPGGTEVIDVGTSHQGRLDGIEILGGTIYVASQADSTIRTIAGGAEEAIIRTNGAPADIGLDMERRRLAVPYIALNRVEIWALP